MMPLRRKKPVASLRKHGDAAEKHKPKVAKVMKVMKATALK